MDARAASEDFVPFVPRPHAGEPPASPCGPDQAPAPEEQGEPAAGAPAPAAPASATQTDIQAEIESQKTAPLGDASQPATDEQPAIRGCHHEESIRAQAIRLAVIACGRALRHVAAVHPALVARFIDEAIAAAGAPPQSPVRVISDGYSADEGMVMVACEGVTIGADIATRAELLVRAAADG
jgi:hypothetical protein